MQEEVFPMCQVDIVGDFHTVTGTAGQFPENGIQSI